MKVKVILFLLLAAVAASVGWLLLRDDDSDAVMARISRDGVTIEEIRLDRVKEPFTRTLEDTTGTNVIAVEQGRIRIIEADCFDQICVHQGWISDSSLPIICLPHRLVVEIVGTEGDLDGGAG